MECVLGSDWRNNNSEMVIRHATEAEREKTRCDCVCLDLINYIKKKINQRGPSHVFGPKRGKAALRAPNQHIQTQTGTRRIDGIGSPANVPTSQTIEACPDAY